MTGSIQALEKPGWVVISESIARRYFKDENPIGKLAYLEKPVHTWKCFDIPDYRGHEGYATPFIHSSRRDSGFSVIEHSFRYNMGNAVQTFIQLTDGADVQKVEEQLLQIEYRESDYIREQRSYCSCNRYGKCTCTRITYKTLTSPSPKGRGSLTGFCSESSYSSCRWHFCNYLIIKLATSG